MAKSHVRDDIKFLLFVSMVGKFSDEELVAVVTAARNGKYQIVPGKERNGEDGVDLTIFYEFGLTEIRR